MASLVRVFVAGCAVTLAGSGCGGDGDDGPTSIDATVGDPQGGLVDVEDASCARDGDQLLGEGIVRNRGDNPHFVSINVRFVDGDGVRIELTSDSVSDLTTGESARWDVTIFSAAAGEVVACEIVAEVS
jgi:catechol 2,3-dioxygenase-like lactoylglutathione lyase family enzyme